MYIADVHGYDRVYFQFFRVVAQSEMEHLCVFASRVCLSDFVYVTFGLVKNICLSIEFKNVSKVEECQSYAMLEKDMLLLQMLVKYGGG